MKSGRRVFSLLILFAVSFAVGRHGRSCVTREIHELPVSQRKTKEADVHFHIKKGDEVLVATYNTRHPAFYMKLPVRNYDKGSLLSAMQEEEYRFAQAVVLSVQQQLVPQDKPCNILDVGANIGYISILAATMGCNVISFEANPTTAHVLQENIRANSLQSKIKVHNKIVSDSEQTSTLKYAVKGSGSIFDHIASTDEVEGHIEEGFSIIDVQSTRLEDNIPVSTDFQLVKIDCEGCEAMSVKTLGSLLENARVKLLLFEWVPARVRHLSGAQSPEEMVTFLSTNGYKVRQAISPLSFPTRLFCGSFL